LAHHVAAPNHTSRLCQNGPGGQRHSMNLAVQAGLRPSTSGGEHRTLLAALLAALVPSWRSLIRIGPNCVYRACSAARTCPCAVGIWHLDCHGRVGGEYKPDFEWANRAMLSPVPIFAIRRAGTTEQFVARATAQASHSSTSATFVPAPLRSSSRHESNYNYSELNGLGDVKAAVQLGRLHRILSG